MLKKLFFTMLVVGMIFTTPVAIMAQGGIATNPLDGETYESPNGEEYNAEWSGWRLSQDDLPEPENREAHNLIVSIPEGTYVFNGVECRLSRDDSGRIIVGRRENGATFIVREEGDYYVDCLKSQMTGFEIVAEGYTPEAESTNPMAGFTFLPNNGDESYMAVWGGETGWWLHQPNLPTTREAFELKVALWPGLEYRFNGRKCQLEIDNEVIANRANAVEFSVPDGDDVIMAEVSCIADPASGFSIETATEPETEPNWHCISLTVGNQTSRADGWEQLCEIFAEADAD